MRRRVPDSILDRSYCPKCGKAVLDLIYEIHVLRCKGNKGFDLSLLRFDDEEDEYEPSCSFPSFNLSNNDDDEEWTPYSYQLGKTSSNSILDRALEHDLKMFGSSDAVRLYEKPIDYSCSSLTTVPLKLTEYTGELALSTSLERQLSRTIGDVSLPSFGESLIENAVTGIPSAGISFIYGKPTSARDELGLSGLAGLATLVMGGPVAALTVIGIGFLKSILKWIFG